MLIENVVTLAPQRPEKSQRFQLAGGVQFASSDEVLLVDVVEVRIVFQQVPRSRPQYQRVNRCVRKIRAQLVDERRGQQRVADARQGNDQNFHSDETTKYTKHTNGIQKT